MAETFGDRIRKLRTAKGMNQEETAALLDTPKQTWSNWETGAASPRPGMIVRLAEYFNVTTDFLLGHDIEAAKYVASVAQDPFSDEYAAMIARAKSAGASDENIMLAISLAAKTAEDAQKKTPQ